MSIEKAKIRSALPFNVPYKKEDIYSLSFSDFIAKINETYNSIVPLKPSTPSKITTDKMVIPMDPILPIFLKRPVVNFNQILQDISKFTNPFLIPSGDPDSIWSLDVIFEKLFKSNSINIIKKSVYYCDFCGTQLSNRDIHFEKGELKKLYAKIKISENTYFIFEGPEEVVLHLDGININPDSIFILQNLGEEKWIIEKNVFERLKEKTIIFPSKMEEKKGKEIVDEFKIVKATFIQEMPTKFLSSDISDNDAIIIGEDGKKIPVEIIDHESIEGNVPHCNYCNKKVTKKRLKGVYLKFNNLNFSIFPKNFIRINEKNILISKDFKNFPKLPIVECDKCGRFEYSQNEKSCICGGLMTKKYSYDPSILPLGVYTMVQSYKNKGILNHKEFKHRFLMLAFMSELKANFFSDIFIYYTDLKNYDNFSNEDPEVIRLSFICKKNGKFHESDVRRFKKLKNMFVNIISYSEIHGVRDVENIIDLWIFSELEKFKEEILNFLENYNFGAIIRNYEFLIYKFSRDYLQMLRKNKINSQAFNELLILSYPFFPNSTKKFANKFGIDLNDFKIGKFSINQTIEKLEMQLKMGKREILKIKRNKELPESIPLKKLIIEVDFKYIPLLINIKQELMKYFNAFNIEITEKWQGLEYRAKLNKDKLGEIYKPLANIIENVLSKIDAKKLKEEIQKHNYEIGVEGNLIIITPQMVDFVYELPKNFEMIDLTNIKLFVNFEKDEEIINFDIVKRLSRNISWMRKKAGIEYDDFIDVSISNSTLIKNSLKGYIQKFKENLKIRNINFSDRITESLILTFNNIVEGEIEIGISPVYRKYKIKAISKLPGLTNEDAENIYNAGFTTIDEIRKKDPKLISEKSNVPLSKIKIIKDYLNNILSFKVLIIKEKYYCPMCESELNSMEKNCPKCQVTLDWS
ncbi:MAG: DUF5915 domain-containing protein [Thermoplasmata archaeon]